MPSGLHQLHIKSPFLFRDQTPFLRYRGQMSGGSFSLLGQSSLRLTFSPPAALPRLLGAQPHNTWELSPGRSTKVSACWNRLGPLVMKCETMPGPSIKPSLPDAAPERRGGARFPKRWMRSQAECSPSTHVRDKRRERSMWLQQKLTEKKLEFELTLCLAEL